MSGHAVQGVQRFVAKEGVPFDARLNVQFHSDELRQASALKRPDETLPDYVRAALREKLLRDSRK